jgi:hypothetical protein
LKIKEFRFPIKQSENFPLLLRCSLPESRRSILIGEGVASFGVTITTNRFYRPSAR